MAFNGLPITGKKQTASKFFFLPQIFTDFQKLDKKRYVFFVGLIGLLDDAKDNLTFAIY